MYTLQKLAHKVENLKKKLKKLKVCQRLCPQIASDQNNLPDKLL